MLNKTKKASNGNNLFRIYTSAYVIIITAHISPLDSYYVSCQNPINAHNILDRAIIKSESVNSLGRSFLFSRLIDDFGPCCPQIRSIKFDDSQVKRQSL